MLLSASLEQYLNTIYRLDKENIGVRVTDISEDLQVKKSSTNKALNILKQEGLINYEKYKNITLTKQGIAMAKHVNKRNTLFKKFLVEILDVNENLATSEAEELAHCISCHTTAKLERYIEEIFCMCKNEECLIKQRRRENENG